MYDQSQYSLEKILDMMSRENNDFSDDKYHMVINPNHL